jgi:hypothetical protein
MKSEVFSVNYQFVIVYTFTNEQKTMQSLFQQSISLFYFIFPNQVISVSPTHAHQRNQFIVCIQGLQAQITGRKDNWKSCSVLEDNIKMGLEEIDFECTDQAPPFTC